MEGSEYFDIDDKRVYLSLKRLSSSELKNTIENDITKRNHSIGVEDNLKSSFFENIKYYKKGTLHLTFRDDDVLRKFNIIACKAKGWLPSDYGYKSYEDYTEKDRLIVDSFEGKESYKASMVSKPQFARKESGNLLIGN